MQCPACKKEMVLPRYAWYSVESYRESAVVVAECCQSPIILSPDMRYTAEEYIGTRTEDDWGIKIPQ